MSLLQRPPTLRILFLSACAAVTIYVIIFQPSTFPVLQRTDELTTKLPITAPSFVHIFRVPATLWQASSTLSLKPVANSYPETRIIKHAPGWTIFENLYMSRGTFYIISSKQWQLPPIRMMTSTGLEALATPESVVAREPTRQDMAIIGPLDAPTLWGNHVLPVPNVTFFLNDPPQFLSHYYHFVAETFFGFWRMFSSLDSNVNAFGETTLEHPARIILARCESRQWRDAGGLNNFFVRSAFPFISIETAPDWQDRIIRTQTYRKVFRFDKVVFSDRSAAFRGEHCGERNQRIASEAFEATRNESSRWWWEPIRRSVLNSAGVNRVTMDVNVPLVQENTPSETGGDGKVPVVVTYISRQQQSRRRLRNEDHDRLVASLMDMRGKKGWEVNIVEMEDLGVEEQLKLAARTTILLGVHGNGLTHLIAMPSTPISTVIEIFAPKGHAKDYEWTTRALGMAHYTIWNDTSFTHPNEPIVAYPAHFQGVEIPVYGPAIVQLIEDRVSSIIPS